MHSQFWPKHPDYKKYKRVLVIVHPRSSWRKCPGAASFSEFDVARYKKSEVRAQIHNKHDAR